MSDQNPIHRDRGKRDQGSQPYQDDRETFGQKQAKIERNAPLDEDQGAVPEEQFRREASERLAEADNADDDKNA